MISKSCTRDSWKVDWLSLSGEEKKEIVDIHNNYRSRKTQCSNIPKYVSYYIDSDDCNYYYYYYFF